MWFIDGHGQMYFTENGRVFYVDTRAKALFDIGTVGKTARWFFEHENQGERIYRLESGANVPLDSLASGMLG